MADNLTRLRPEPQFSQEQLALIATAAGAMVNAGLQLLDVLGGDPDVEDATDVEDEGIQPQHLRNGGVSCQVSDPSEYSLEERHGKQPELKQSPIHEDHEEDDPQGEVTDDEPGFDKGSRAIANCTGHGAGCIISDPDYGGEEAGEPEEA